MHQDQTRPPLDASCVTTASAKVLTEVLEQIMGGCCIKIEPAANVIAADIDLNYVANISIQQRVLIESQNGYFSVESSICHVVVDE